VTSYTAESNFIADPATSWRPATAARRRWFRTPVRNEVLSTIAERVLGKEAGTSRYRRGRAANTQIAADYLVATSGDRCDVDHVFDRLRWGGQFVFIGSRSREAEQLIDRYRACDDFLVETDVQAISRPGSRWRRRDFMKTYYGFVARKTALTRTGDATDRYTYDVGLVPDSNMDEHYAVLKQVPTYENAVRRLMQNCPEADARQVEQGARKLVAKVFPLFLTRETAFLKILQRNLPESCRHRVPAVLHFETDDRGLVRQVTLKWLRLGGRPLTQLEFARQSSALLHIVHEHVGLIHMDLRLDNFVVTERGVGFVDFGSAVRVGERFDRNPMLDSLFHEMLSTSQIQKDLARYRDEGKLTSRLFVNSCRKFEKAVDLFYLVLQMNRPHANQDFEGLVRYDRHSAEAHELARLTRAVFRPKDPGRPMCRSAKELAKRIAAIERGLSR
jgi:hypothetical protein